MEILWNKPCVDLIDLYKILIKEIVPIILKSVTMIDPVSRWFEIMKCNDKRAMMIEKLVETTWLVQYPWPVKIM